jgi:hypothetical protein
VTFFCTSKIKPRREVGLRQKKGRNGSETDRIVNKNERLQKDENPVHTCSLNI